LVDASQCHKKRLVSRALLHFFVRNFEVEKFKRIAVATPQALGIKINENEGIKRCCVKIAHIGIVQLCTVITICRIFEGAPRSEKK